MPDFTKILKELTEERQRLDEAIRVMQQLVAGTGKRRGRPPLWLQAAKAKEAHDGK
jgi:hypothetical protein